MTPRTFDLPCMCVSTLARRIHDIEARNSPHNFARRWSHSRIPIATVDRQHMTIRNVYALMQPLREEYAKNKLTK